MSPSLPAILDLVIVRYIELRDHAAYIALERDADVKRFVNGPSTKSDEQLRSGLQDYQPTTELLAIADLRTNDFIGRCGLLPVGKTNESEVYCLLARSHWHLGIGQQIIPLLARIAQQEDRIAVGIVDPSNKASLALLQRLGYSPSGFAQGANYQNAHIRYVLSGTERASSDDPTLA